MTVAYTPLPELALNGSVVVETVLGPVLLCRTQAGLRALRPLCPHQRLSLEGARIRGQVLACPHHGARFSLEDGRSLSPLTPIPLQVLACRVAGDHAVIDS